MMLRFTRLLRRDPERGVALPVVLGLGLVMLTLVAGSMAVVTSGIRKTNSDANWNAALQVAYAAVDDYTSRLANDPSYQYYGNPSAPFSISTGSTVTAPPVDNPAFGVGTAGDWAPMVGNDDASFRYEVDNHAYQSAGQLRIRATGRVGADTRSVVAQLHQSGFLDFMYFTIYEVQDPQVSGKTGCEMYQYNGRPTSLDCDIDFAAADVLNGPVHSNDTLSICGATFNDKVTSSDPGGTSNWTKSCASNPTWNTGALFNPNSRPVYRAAINMPDSNSDLRKETFTDRPASVPDPGCLYTGPTIITFLANGKMNVISPWTKFTQITEAGVGSNPAKCGTIAALTSANGATIDTLPNNLIYVQAVPTSGTDPNKRALTDPLFPSIVDCSTTTAMKMREDGTTIVSGGFKYNGTKNAAFSNAPYQYPLPNEALDRYDSSTSNPAYDCKSGDVYVRGSFGGKMTIAASRYIYVTGDITYQTPTTDVLGLVGDSAVWIWNPITVSGSTYSWGQFQDRTINAALLSVKHTVQVQNYNGVATWQYTRCGSNWSWKADDYVSGRKLLTINGTLVQKFRGTVGATMLSSCSSTYTAGFNKNYGYDQRFKFNAPPKFLRPTSTTYGVSQYASTSPAFKANGAAN